MAGDSQNMERSTLERKDRAELAAVAAALGLKVPSRAKKADIVTLILDVVAQPGDSASSAPEAPSSDRATDSPADIAAEATGAAVVEATTDAPLAGQQQLPTVEADHEAADDADGSASQPHDEANDEANDEPASADDDASADVSSPSDGGETPEGEGGGRNRRRRRRGRDRAEGDTGTGAGAPGQEFDGEPVEVSGLLDLRDDGYGFLRVAGFLPSRDDVYVSVKQCRQLGLRKGDHLTGLARPAGHKEKNPALTRVETVNGMDPEAARNRPRFDDLTPILPDDELALARESTDGDRTGALIDAIAPIGKGQRAIVAAPPRSGRTEVLKQIATSIEANHPDVQLIVLLIDERPEDVTEFRRTIEGGEVVASTFDRPAEEHTAVAELTIEHAKRLVEYGYDVAILLDGITRLAKAYNVTAAPNGHILAGGLDASALYPTKRFFGAARNIEEGGSLTVVATAAIETGSALDAAIYDEFKDTANRELRLTGDSSGALNVALDTSATPAAQQNLLDELERRAQG